MRLTALETKVLDKALEMDQPFTPTEIGVALGYAQQQASSRVAPALKRLVETRCMKKNKTSHSRVTYEVL